MGCNWYDFYTNEKYAGGQYIEVNLKDEYIPVFAKEGAIISI